MQSAGLTLGSTAKQGEEHVQRCESDVHKLEPLT